MPLGELVECRSISASTSDREALLPRYDDETALQRELHQKMHSYQMVRALSMGFMPSNEQLVINLRTLLAADVLNPQNPDLSDSGRQLVRYVKQETLGPLKAIGRTLAFGAGGAIMLGAGGILLLVGLLRALQSETGPLFAGEWSWAPYFPTLIADLIASDLIAAFVYATRNVRLGASDIERPSARSFRRITANTAPRPSHLVVHKPPCL